MTSHKQQRSLFDLGDATPGSEAQSAAGQGGAGEKKAPASTGKPRPAVDKAKARGPKKPHTLADLKGKTVYVIDAPSLIYQVFHAIPEMTSPRGLPVNAVYGFTRDIMTMLEGGDANYLFCAFDASGPTFRHEAYEKYKAERAAMPDDLRPQMQIIADVLSALKVPVLELSGYEADDILATIAQQAHAAGAKCLLVTGDKDCRQLITESTFVFNVRKQQVYDAAALQADWGVRPEQVVDFQSLVGDKVDNVPGVPLIGPKIAAELLKQFGDLENVFANIDKVNGAKRKENLTNFQDQALLSRDLVRLERNVPIEVDWEAARISDFDYPASLEMFVDLGFHSFAEKVRQLAPEIGPPAATEVTLVRTADERAELLKNLAEQREFAFALLQDDPAARFGRAVGIAFSWEENSASYVSLTESFSNDEELRSFLQQSLQQERATVIAHDLKVAMLALREAGLGEFAKKFDTQLASYLLDAGERDHSLGEAAKKRLGRAVPAWKEMLGKRKSGRELALEDRADLAGAWAEATLMLKPKLDEQLQQAGLDELYDSLELPLVDALVEMESNGIAVDTQRLAELSSEFAAHINSLQQHIHELAGREFNVASPRQLQQVLFEELGLPILKKTARSGPSTDSEVLEELVDQHPIASLILEYRQYAKLKGTYLDALPVLVCLKTNRVHADFNQMVAATGRLSCNDPNLQNIPIRSEAGRKIRSAFVPGVDGWELLAADYSQIELRVLAEFSQDEALREAFARDKDIHTTVAAQVFGMADDEVTPELRRRAKAVNFGVIYGQTPFGLAKQLKISTSEAAEFIDAYFARYPGVEGFMTKILADCAANGYVKTVLGRRRFVRGVRTNLDPAKARRQRNLSERTAINTVIQGSAADLIKLAMLRIHRRLIDERLRPQVFSSTSHPAQLLLQIHDELVFEAAADQILPLAELVSQEMSQVMPFDVPLKVDLSRGFNLAELHSL